MALCLCRFRQTFVRFIGFTSSHSSLSKTLTELDASENSIKPEKHEEIKATNSEEASDTSFSELSEYRFVYPEFLPDRNFRKRNKIREKLERKDMLSRRSAVDLPEFYVGSVLAVTASDPNAPGKLSRFVGICISRTHWALASTFILRNVVDKQGVEIMYDLYNPTIQKIEVLRLEKRLDDELLYLRDTDPEHSTFPFDMEPEFIPEGEPVRINPLKVKLKPGRWYARWEFHDLKGVENIEVNEKRQRRADKLKTPWEKYDLMKDYRRTIPEEEQMEIWPDVHAHKKEFEFKKLQWKQSVLQKSVPTK